MLNTLFSAIYSNTFTIDVYLICTAVSLVLGAIVALTANFRARLSKSFLLALFLIPAIVQTVIMLVNGSVGTGVAVMGAFSLVRFRSVAGSAKEIVSIFLAMAAGLATAMGYLALAVLFVGIICIAMFAASFIRLKDRDDLVRELKITIPEDLNYAHSFDVYNVELKNEDDMQSFIDELRCRNGNLEIALLVPAVAEATL